MLFGANKKKLINFKYIGFDMGDTLCTSGTVKLLAGAYASSTITSSGTYLTTFINEAEGDFIADTRVNWIALWPKISGTAYVKAIENAVASKAAIKVINYDMSGYDSLAQATTMMNVLWADYDRAVRTLSEDKVVTFFGGTKGQ